MAVVVVVVVWEVLSGCDVVDGKAEELLKIATVPELRVVSYADKRFLDLSEVRHESLSFRCTTAGTNN